MPLDCVTMPVSPSAWGLKAWFSGLVSYGSSLHLELVANGGSSWMSQAPKPPFSDTVVK